MASGGGAAEAGGRVPDPDVLDRLAAHLVDRAAMLRRHAHAGFDLSPGLSEAELDGIEDRWGFTVPADLRAVLRAFVPVGGSWVDWRAPDAVQQRLDWPADGIAFDVTEAGLWLPEWGDRPEDDREATRIARTAISEAPKLVPLASHRYLVAEPSVVGNPVISVYQSDVIFYGDNLIDWFHRDHDFESAVPSDGPERDLGLWRRFLDDDDLW